MQLDDGGRAARLGVVVGIGPLSGEAVGRYGKGMWKGRGWDGFGAVKG